MLISMIPHNSDVPCSRWKAWAGTPAPEALLYFNQWSARDLDQSIPYIVDLGRKLKQQAPQVQPVWNVPFPGPFRMGEVANGEHDALYRRLFEQALAIFAPESTGRIKVRIAWEFNLDGWLDAQGTGEGQQNTAKDRSARFNDALYVLAYRRIAEIARKVSPRFWLIWCPNHGRQLVAKLETYYPGDDVVDEIGFDFYFQKALWLDQPASNVIAPGSGYGLQWLVTFARGRGKPWCLPELGADHDHFAPELRKLLAWAKTQGCRWVGWWDRTEVIDTRISTGDLPAIGAVVKEFV